MGRLDDSKALKQREMFIQVSCTSGNNRFHHSWYFSFTQNHQSSGINKSQGKIVVVKKLCLHPRDVQNMYVVNTLKLHHMVDYIFFLQQGEGSHPDKCSGSDLDGGLYYISLDKFLIPSQ